MTFVGMAAGFLGLYRIIGASGVIALALGGTALTAAARWRPMRPVGRTLRWIAWAALAPVFGFFAYEVVAFGSMLWWAIPAWGWMLVIALALASACPPTLRRRLTWLMRVPAVAPLGTFVALCLYGWTVEAGTARCEDYRRVVSQHGVELALPSAADLPLCHLGERVRPAGHPRKLFPAGAGRFFSTVEYAGPDGGDPASTFTGGVCEITLGMGRDAMPRCRQDLPAAYGLLYRSQADSLLVSGHTGVRELRASPPFAVQAAADIGEIVSFVHDRDRGRVLAFRDDMTGVDVLDDALRPLGKVALPIAPEEVRYDPARGEGLYCFASTPLFPIGGRGYLSLAIGRDPLDVRPIGSTDRVPWAWLAFSDGCDLDISARLAYVGVGTLGLAAVLDYDSGAVRRLDWVGFGVRPVFLDRDTQRLYAGNYLDGWVRELDATTGELRRRWFVGRFVRHIVPDPRGDALLVTSTLGIVRIRPAEGSHA